MTWTPARLRGALALACAIEIAVYAFGQLDFIASDPLWYSDIAHRLATDPGAVLATHDAHPFVMRLGLTGQLAVLYRVFGTSTAVADLPSLVAALEILCVIFCAMPTPRGKLVGLGVGVFSIPLVQNMCVLNVDLPCAALMAVSVLWLSFRDRGRAWLVAAAVAWLAAFLVKEVAIWEAPVWIYAAICDRRALRRWLPAVVIGGALGAAYLAFCAAVWGSPLARFHGIDVLDHAWALPGQPAGAWLARLGWGPAVMLAKLFTVTLAPALVAPWLVRGRERIWVVAAAAFVGLYWFGSSSLSVYSPLPLSPRMVLPALPPILVLAALACDRAIGDRTAPPSGGAAGRAQVPTGASRVLAVVLGLAIALPAGRVMINQVRRARPETHAFAQLRAAAAAEPDARFVLVCGEPRCVDIAPFYFGYAVPANVTVLFANDFAAAPAPAPGAARVQALVNFPRAEGAHRTDPHTDRTHDIAALNLPVLAGNQNVQLLDAGDGGALHAALRR